MPDPDYEQNLGHPEVVLPATTLSPERGSDRFFTTLVHVARDRVAPIAIKTVLGITSCVVGGAIGAELVTLIYSVPIETVRSLVLGKGLPPLPTLQELSQVGLFIAAVGGGYGAIVGAGVGLRDGIVNRWG